MSLSRRQRRRIHKFHEQDGACCYCAGEMTLVQFAQGISPSASTATLEHIHQRADGGTYEDENTKVACASCNESRPDGVTSEDYLILRRRLMTMWPACSWPLRPIRQLLAKIARKARAALNEKIAA